jgi:hypothetical protein
MLLWFGYGLSVLARGSHIGNLVPKVVMFRGAGKVIRAQGTPLFLSQKEVMLLFSWDPS